MTKKYTQIVSLDTPIRPLRKKKLEKTSKSNQIMFGVTVKSLLFVHKENVGFVARYIYVPKKLCFIMKYI